jgi:phosphopantothenoylcysteine decarboxylase/phosphopantothenate--cysteine ligase
VTRVPATRRPWRGSRILLGVTGGIAAYKSVQLARDLTRLGAEVDVVLTRAARKFVGKASFQGVTGRDVHTDLWDLSGDGGAALHLRLGYEADAVCIAPATADTLARLAGGHANDLLTTALLATRAPVLLCPAMNDRMFGHPQVQANLEHLRSVLGHHVAGPDTGPLAVGEGEGPGRMVEPAHIVEWLGRLLEDGSSLQGVRVLVTAGPTREPVDEVRYLGNRSSGRMGFALARAAWRRGARVTLVTGPVDLPPPREVEVVRVETAREMEAAVRSRLDGVGVAIFAAAVADFRPETVAEGKLSRRDGEIPPLALAENPDIARTTREALEPGAVSVGFALEASDHDLVERARAKLREKGFDLVVANVPGPDSGFGVDTNRVTLVGLRDSEPLELLTKDEVAEAILDRVKRRLGRTAPPAETRE